jgi:transposase, IS5 family
VAAPGERNTAEEKAEIKAGRVPAERKSRPAKLRSKDGHARWTVKFSKAKPDKAGTIPATDLASGVWLPEPCGHRRRFRPDAI